MQTSSTQRLYESGADDLMRAQEFAERVSLLPAGGGRPEPGTRIRILWGQDMLKDLLDGRYRTVVCGVNEEDNSHGIVAQLVGLVPSSQWNEPAVTSYAKMFAQAVGVHAAHDREPYVLKYDLDSILILALLRPRGRDHFTLQDLSHGFSTISKMLQGRRERRPIASVSFLGARSNRLIAGSGSHADREPSFEGVLKAIYGAGYRGDIYPSTALWGAGDVGVFPSYPFPDGLERMREGSS